MDLVKMDFRKGMVKQLFDIMGLKYIRENGSLAGYDFLKWIHKKYGVLLSSGTVYSKLSSLERRGLVKEGLGERKKVYTLTKKGEAMLKSLLSDPVTEQFLTLLEKPLTKEEMRSLE